MRILVVKRDKIGDLLLTTPLLAHLRRTRPRDEIHLLANDYNAWVVRDNPSVDRLWVYSRVRTGRKVSVPAAFASGWQLVQLRRQRFDVAIVANGAESHRAIKRALAVGAKRVVAYAEDPARWPRVSDPLPPDRERHECDALLGLLAPLGIPPPAEPVWPVFNLPAGEQAFAERWLAERRLAPRRFVVLGLGARRAKKQPTRDQILAWTRRFRDELALDTVFMWTPGRSDSPLYPGDDDVAQPVLDARAVDPPVPRPDPARARARVERAHVALPRLGADALRRREPGRRARVLRRDRRLPFARQLGAARPARDLPGGAQERRRAARGRRARHRARARRGPLRPAFEASVPLTAGYAVNTLVLPKLGTSAMAVTTIKLPDELKERIADVVRDTGKSVHAFMLDAIEQQTRLAELRRQFVADALAAEADALKSGLGFSAADVHAYIEALAKGRKARRPRAKQWRR